MNYAIQAELFDTGSIAEEMDSCIEEDFESFLNWVQTENPVPPNFTFEESYKQGKLMPFLRFTNR